MKINKILPQEHKYLQITTTIAKPPQQLYYIGTLPTERKISVAVVGSRRPTAYGTEVTTMLAGELAAHGIVIVSGLALGVDALAHQAALDAGGTTIAVLANPLPDICPRANRQLGEQIIASDGAIIAEHDQDYIVHPSSFLERNRIVAGLADAVLITEANVRSGSLNTAMYALDQGKDVFVVPGNITSPLSGGCNALLKQGAQAATSVNDILTVLLPGKTGSQTQLALGDTPAESAIIQALSSGLRDADEILARLAISAHEFNIALTMLELNGTITPLGANKWRLR